MILMPVRTRRKKGMTHDGLSPTSCRVSSSDASSGSVGSAPCQIRSFQRQFLHGIAVLDKAFGAGEGGNQRPAFVNIFQIFQHKFALRLHHIVASGTHLGVDFGGVVGQLLHELHGAGDFFTDRSQV